ncbi:MAG: sulfatase-like hydrolase/transferase [Candidatus Dadabacteria bacterium]|nr:sulfatase-like hydrolase/transferase [Candidatus Dadabacteria bacterium]
MEQAVRSDKKVLLAALSLAIVFSILDVSIGIVKTYLQFPLFRSALLTIAVSAGVFLAVFAVLWPAVGRPVSRRFNPGSAPAAISIGVFIGVTMLLVSLNYDLFNTWGRSYAWELAAFLAVSAAIGALVYFAAAGIARLAQGAAIGNFLALFLPVLSIEIMLAVWLARFGRYTGYELSLGFFIALFLTLAVSMKLVRTKMDPAFPLVMLAVCALLVSPAAFLLTRESYEAEASRVEETTDHDVSHVILITIDTLRKDSLSAYGSERVETPTIDGFASDGELFENAYSSSSWTLPSFASMMTGLPVTVHKTARADSMLPDEFMTIAERLRDSGYYTAAIVDNFFLHPEFNMNQGFLEYNYYPKRQKAINSFGVTVVNQVFPELLKHYTSTKDLTDVSLKWLGENRDRDFFLWLHYYDPHIPYAPPREYISKDAVKDDGIGYVFESARNIRSGHFSPNEAKRKWIRELYDAEVRYVDHELGRFIAALRQYGIYDDALIIVTSDHGEEFWDHGGYEHGHTLYNEVIGVPLIIKLPGMKSGERRAEEVSTRSIPATVLDVVGVEYGSDSMMAESLTPLLDESPAAYSKPPITSTGVLYYEDKESVVFGSSKFIRSIVTGQEELYDLSKDPGERNRLPLAENGGLAGKGRSLLSEDREKAGKAGKELGVSEAKKVDLDNEKKEQLKALNYLQ